MKKNKKTIKSPKRPRAMQIRLSEKEYKAITDFCKENKINNRARWIRELIIKELFLSIERNAPTIFDHPDYVDDDNDKDDYQQTFMNFE